MKEFHSRHLRLCTAVWLVAAAAATGLACSKTPPAPTATPPQRTAVAPVPASPTPTATPLLPTATPTPLPTPATLEVPISVRGASSLGSLQFEVRYDPQNIVLQSVKAGSLARNILLDSNKDTPGLVRIGLVAASGISGDGQVAVLVFAYAVRGPTDLTIQNLVASDVNLHDLVTSVAPGTVSAGGQASGPVISFRQ